MAIYQIVGFHPDDACFVRAEELYIGKCFEVKEENLKYLNENPSIPGFRQFYGKIDWLVPDSPPVTMAFYAVILKKLFP